METRTTKYKNFVIDTETGIERGLFFRKPIQKVTFDATFDVFYDEPSLNAWKYADDIKRPIRRLYEVILGNSSIINNIEKWKEDINWGGFSANILCCPIYFKREYRKLKALSVNEDNIQSIVSYGYEGEYNDCAGNCVVEKTIIILKNGKRIKKKIRGSYKYTYERMVKEIIDEE